MASRGRPSGLHRFSLSSVYAALQFWFFPVTATRSLQSLSGRGAFERVFRTGRRRRLRGVFVIGAKRHHVGMASLGISVPKRQVRRAVDRNRIRRIVRESFRHVRCRLGAIDVVVVVRSQCLNHDNKTLRGILDELWDRIASCDIP